MTEGSSELNAEREAIVRSTVDAWNRRDLDALTALAHPDIEYVNSPGAVEPGTRRGLSEATAVMRAQWEMLAGGKHTIDHIHHRDEDAVSVGRVSRRMPGSETRIDDPVLTSWTIRDGKLARIEVLGFGAEFPAALKRPDCLASDAEQQEELRTEAALRREPADPEGRG